MASAKDDGRQAMTQMRRNDAYWDVTYVVSLIGASVLLIGALGGALAVDEQRRASEDRRSVTN